MKKRKVYLIPNTHSDLQYLKSYKEYLPMHLSNLKEGLDILNKYPEYTYLTEHIAILEEFWKRFPNYREKIKQFAQEGRLEISPNMYCISDMNIPCGESLIQQVYYGKSWTKKYLGTESKTAWIADSFGLNRQLPQILKGCGYLYCAFVRGIDNPERKSEFIWQGLDKTEILTHWLIFGYGGIGSFSNNKEKDFAKLRKYIKELKDHSTSSKILLGNGGDFLKPSPLSCQRIKEWNKTTKEKIIFSTPSEYFFDLLKEKPKLKVLKGEFNPDKQGCYSSRIKVKQKNRFLENKILTAEKISVLTSFLGKPYPSEELGKAWKKILFYQFHDSICGTIVDSAYKEVLQANKETEKILNKVLSENLDFLANRIKGSEKRRLIFNPLSWERKDLFEIEGKSPQIITIPPLGYKRFNLTSKKIPNAFKIKDNQIENKFYKIKLGENGLISSLISKENNFEYVDQKNPFFNDLVIQDDNGDLWQYYEAPLVDIIGWGFAQDNYKDPIPTKPKLSQSGKRQIGFFIHSKDTQNKVEIIEKGPVRVTIKVEGTFSFWQIKVKFIQYIYLYNNLKRIDFKTEIFPSGRHYRIRVCFPAPIKKGKIYHEIPFGNIKRPEGEFPAQNWLAYEDKEKGLLLLNKGLPGNNVTDGIMMLSLMRSVAMEYKGPSEAAFEEGIHHTFNYSLIPYSQKSFSFFTRKGLEFNNPLIIWSPPPLRGRIEEGGQFIEIPGEASFIRITPENIVLSALRRIEDGTMLRVYETEGKGCKGRIEFSKRLKLKIIEETDFLGRTKEEKMRVRENILEFSILPYQIKTFKLRERRFNG